jgi:6-methylsalicylic acid synthase
VACSPAENDLGLPRSVDVTELRARCAEQLDSNFVIERLASIGVAAMGFPWRIEELRKAEGELIAWVTADPEAETAPGSWASVLDAALSMASVVFPGQPTLRMPAHIRQFAVTGDSPARVLIRARTVAGGQAVDTVDVDIATVDGQVLASFAGLRYGVLDGDVGAPASPRRLVHELVWRPLEFEAADSSVDSVVFVGDGVAGTLVAPLAAAGVRTISLRDPEELEALQGELTANSVVMASSAADGPIADAALQSAWVLTRTAQVLAGWEAGTPVPRLWCVTGNAREAEDDAGLGQSPLWGVGRIVGGEHPEIWGGLIDLARGEDVDAELLTGILAARPEADVIALRDGVALTSRLATIEQEQTKTAFYCKPDGTYLITGGLGALGLEVAEWLVDHGARRLVLVGRRDLPPREDWDVIEDSSVAAQVQAIRALETAGVTVRTLALDITDAAQVTELLRPGALGLPPIRGVVHAAGALDNRLLRDVDEASLRTVMAPKVDGALVLHELFPPGSLDFLALFSSCGQLLGLPGQASYAAANAFLDALAAHRRSLGDKGTISFGWTSWRGLGMSTSSKLIDAELAVKGTGDITAAEAFRAWEFADRCDVPYVAVLRVHPVPPGGERPALLRDLAVEEPARGADAEETPWSGLTGAELQEFLVGEVCRQVAAEMKLPPEELDARRPLIEIGLDSVMTLIIRRRLERQFRVGLPATLLWNRPTVLAVADYLADLLTEADGSSAPATAEGLVSPQPAT